MHKSFHALFNELVVQNITTPKEVAFMTKRSGSTVYRWLRGESTPDIDDFARMIHGADPPVRERLLAWLSQDLPLRVAWVAGPSDAALAEQPLEHVTAAVKDQTVSAVERLLDTIRWHDSQVGTSPTLSPAQFEDLESRLDDVLNQVMLIKRLHRSRMVERKRARPNA